jgi:hypothetical protein
MRIGADGNGRGGDAAANAAAIADPSNTATATGGTGGNGGVGFNSGKTRRYIRDAPPGRSRLGFSGDRSVSFFGSFA